MEKKCGEENDVNVQWFARKYSLEITPISGVLRVTLSSGPHLWDAAFDAIASGVFFWFLLPHVHTLSIFRRSVIAVCAASAVGGIVQLLRPSESVFEFGKDLFRIKKPAFAGIARTTEYAVRKCSDLTWHEPDDEAASVLEFKYGSRTINFGGGLTVQQAQDILASLQEHLPDVAQRMGISFSDEKSHYTRLGLS